MQGKEFKENNFKELVANNPERQREIARQGGLASGRSRQKKKEQSIYLSALLNAAADMDFSTPEERAEFYRWKKNKDKRAKRKKRTRNNGK